VSCVAGARARSFNAGLTGSASSHFFSAIIGASKQSMASILAGFERSNDFFSGVSFHFESESVSFEGVGIGSRSEESLRTSIFSDVMVLVTLDEPG